MCSQERQKENNCLLLWEMSWHTSWNQRPKTQKTTLWFYNNWSLEVKELPCSEHYLGAQWLKHLSASQVVMGTFLHQGNLKHLPGLLYWSSLNWVQEKGLGKYRWVCNVNQSPIKCRLAYINMAYPIYLSL